MAGGSQMTRVLCVFGMAALLSPVARVLAVGTPVTANIIEVTATSGGYSDTFQEVFPVGSWDGILSWSLPAPETLSDGAVELGVLSSLEVTFDADPQIDLGFALKNSSLTDPVFFNITTAAIVFDPAPNAEAAATASLTLTQGAGSPQGGYVAGQFTDGKVYEARYGTNPLSFPTIAFADLCPSLNFSSGLGLSATEQLPAVGYSSLGTTVYTMQSEYKFILSPGDQASGTSAFLIIPEPSTASILALGALVLTRRRRGR